MSRKVGRKWKAMREEEQGRIHLKSFLVNQKAKKKADSFI